MNTESQILEVPIEDIIPNRFQPRLNFDEDGLKELASSIKEHGIIQPLVLRRLGDKYEIIAGERRYKAAKIAGLTKVPAIISIMSDQKSAEVAIVENIQRRDLSAIEEAKSYKALLDKGYLTQEELAKKMGISQSAISNKLRLLSLDESVQKALMEGKISERHARTLLKITNKDEQAKWLRIIIEERLTIQNLEKKLKETFDKNEEEIPIMEVNPLNNITNKEETLEDSVIFSNSTNNKIPNKFFNYLEDEQANMSMDETTIIDNSDGIEMLDFDISSPILKDMNKANFLVDALINDLNNNNYQASLEKLEDEKNIKYTIIVKKED